MDTAGAQDFMGCDFAEAVHFQAYFQRRLMPLISRGPPARSCRFLGLSNAHPEFAHPIMNLPRIGAAVTKDQAAPHRRFRVA